ncbi:metabolite traffic protein EboE [Planctomicrobium sp. SH664]|uniref:metabolite traffic protein EboE n=1 Tax=Planctomicrobium sp. SH664 TaxID=3448125 RepID=UPI003F5BEAC3
MSLSTLPLGYCTNVHPGQTVAEVLQGLQNFTIPARRQLGSRIAAGLWLPATVIGELEQAPELLPSLQQVLREGELVCYSLNAFPFGNFHGTRVKENVYLPDWAHPDRLRYTARCANVLSELMPEGVEGSISTVPLGFKGFPQPVDFIDRCIGQLLELARQLDELHDETGRIIRLAIEPEPCCLLETTPETLAFFDRLYASAEQRSLLDEARRHLGLCYDVCHQAVEFEDIPGTIRQFSQADVRINKVHITCAIHVEAPLENRSAMEALQAYVEPRYLHQTFVRSRSGEIAHRQDLTRELLESPPVEFREAEAWRVHFHVPVHREELGPLQTTRQELKGALAAVAGLDYAPHLEVETYTWGVLPGEEQPSLEQGVVNELAATQGLLQQIGRDQPSAP